MKWIFKVYLLSVFLVLSLSAGAKSPFSTTTVTCFCKATGNGQDPLFNLTPSPPYQFTGGPGVAFVPANLGDCQNRCRTEAKNRRLEVAGASCANNIPDGTWILIKHTLGTRPYFDTTAFKLINKPAGFRMEWVCPPPWRSNTSNQIGGITGDQRCKKLQGTYSGPAFPNGTQIGANVAFTWGNEIWVYGTTANGGAAIYQQYNLQTTPAVCDLDF